MRSLIASYFPRSRRTQQKGLRRAGHATPPRPPRGHRRQARAHPDPALHRDARRAHARPQLVSAHRLEYGVRRHLQRSTDAAGARGSWLELRRIQSVAPLHATRGLVHVDRAGGRVLGRLRGSSNSIYSSVGSNEGRSRTDLSFAQRYLVNSHCFDRDTPSKRLESRLDVELLDIPRSYVDKYDQLVVRVTRQEADDATRARISSSGPYHRRSGHRERRWRAPSSGFPGVRSLEIVPFDRH